MRTRTDIIEHARSFIGVPWRHQGRSRAGIDCVGLVILVGRELGVMAYDTNDYQRHVMGPGFLRHFRAAMVEKKIVDAQPGDVLLFRDRQFPCHSTILGERKGRLTIIHAHALRRQVLEEEMESEDWMQRRIACFAFPEVEE